MTINSAMLCINKGAAFSTNAAPLFSYHRIDLLLRIAKRSQDLFSMVPFRISRMRVAGRALGEVHGAPHLFDRHAV